MATQATRKLLTWPRVVIGWALFCAGLYVWNVVDAALSEAECNAKGDWFCGPGFAAVLGGIVDFLLFITGLVPIGIVWMLDTRLRRRSTMRARQTPRP